MDSLSSRTLLDDMIGRLSAMEPTRRAAFEKVTMEATKKFRFVPNAGPQTVAYGSLADELYFGGSAGSGKSSLLCGLAVNEHQRSILFRREYAQIKGLEDETARILGTREGYNSQDKVWKLGGDRMLEFGAVQREDDKQKYQGRAHDYVGFDELPLFTESQYTFLIGWNRSAVPNQRCRIVAAGNPPMTPEGYWILRRWAAWLDPTHAKPAKSGELRWYTTIAGEEREVDGPGPHLIDGKQVTARSRTFIGATLEDNPDLMNSGYAAVLEAMQEPYRTMLREGRFDIAHRDAEFQVIPTDWIREAQKRWTPKIPDGIPMCAIGVDVAQGGADQTILAPRYDGWYAPIIATPGKQTPFGKDVAGLVVSHRRNDAIVIIDMGGGYGGAALEHLRENLGSEAVIGYKGAEKSTARTVDRQLPFYNRRSQAYWKFREALDPSQPQGSPIMLPDDPELVADLTAPTFEVGPRGIQVEPKEDVVKRLGRSCDRGDAVVMAWTNGAKLPTHFHEWRADQRTTPPGRGGGATVNFGPRRSGRH